MVRFVKCFEGFHWNYEDYRSLRIYRLENQEFKDCHLSVYQSGDYHAKDKRRNYVGYVNKRWINKRVSRLEKMVRLFEQNILHTLNITLVESIKKVIHKNAKRRTKMEGLGWRMHFRKFDTFKKSLRPKMNLIAPRKIEKSRLKRPSIFNIPGQANCTNFKTILKNRVRITEWVEIVQEKEIVNWNSLIKLNSISLLGTLWVEFRACWLVYLDSL